MAVLRTHRAFKPAFEPQSDRVVDTLINPRRRVSIPPFTARHAAQPSAATEHQAGQSLDGLILLARLMRGQT
jgi:hypothetical protein